MAWQGKILRFVRPPVIFGDLWGVGAAAMPAELGGRLVSGLLEGLGQSVGPGVADGQGDVFDGQRGIDEQVFGAFDAAAGDLGTNGMTLTPAKSAFEGASGHRQLSDDIFDPEIAITVIPNELQGVEDDRIVEEIGRASCRERV